jgi:holin-like protein
LDSWDVLKPTWLPLFVIAIVSTIVVMGVSGRVTQFVMRKK